MKRFFALALLLGAMAVPIIALPGLDAGPVGTAAASECLDNSTYADTAGGYTDRDAVATRPHNWASESAVSSCENLQDDASYYQAARSMRSLYQSFTISYDSALSDSAGTAYIDLEKRVLWEYDNGTSLTNAKLDSQEVIDDFYTVKERNYLENWRAMAHAFDTWQNQSSYNMFSTGGSIDYSQSTAEGRFDGGSFEDFNDKTYAWSLNEYWVDFVGIGSTSHTLVNGSTLTVPTLKFNLSMWVKNPSSSDAYYAFDSKILEITPTTGEYTLSGTTWSDSDVWLSGKGASSGGEEQTYSMSWRNIDYTISSASLNAPPESSYSDKMWIMFSRPNERLGELQTEWSNFDASNEDYTEGIYNGLNSGEITYSDAISRATQIDQYLQQAVSENSTFSIAKVGLAGTGLDAVDVTNTSYMTIEFDAARYSNSTNPVTREGFLLSRTAPADGWVYNTTYDSANLSGGQMVLDMNNTDYTINGTFKILGAYDHNGDPINVSKIQNPEPDSLETYNASAYVEFMNHSSEWIQQIESQLTDGSGAGGSGSGGGGWNWNPFGWLSDALSTGAFKEVATIALVAFGLLAVLAVVS